MKYRYHYAVLISLLSSFAHIAYAQPPTIEFDRRTLLIKNTYIDVDIADTGIEIQMGLMLRDSATPGMLLSYSKPRKISLWMKNMMIPIDVAIINASDTIVEFMHLEAFDEAIKQSSHEGIYALELPKGWFKAHQINIGDQVSFVKKEKR